MMTKYTDNEQYEKDKAALIEYCESPMAKLGYHSQQKIDEISNLLKQSKWTGADNQRENSDYHKPCSILKDA